MCHEICFKWAGVKVGAVHADAVALLPCDTEGTTLEEADPCLFFFSKSNLHSLLPPSLTPSTPPSPPPLQSVWPLCPLSKSVRGGCGPETVTAAPINPPGRPVIKQAVVPELAHSGEGEDSETERRRRGRAAISWLRAAGCGLQPCERIQSERTSSHPGIVSP